MLLFSCEAIGYYTQAAQGQLSIVFSRKNVDTLIATESFPQDLKEKFSEIKLIKEFAGTQLALPVGNNYSSYVDVKRNYMVWNVFAAPEFSMEPFTWCYPIAGCVSYRGYFSKEHALRYAKKLEDRMQYLVLMDHQLHMMHLFMDLKKMDRHIRHKNHGGHYCLCLMVVVGLDSLC